MEKADEEVLESINKNNKTQWKEVKGDREPRL